MRWYVICFACVCMLIVSVCLLSDVSFVQAFEEEAEISAGITTGIVRFPEIGLEYQREDIGSIASVTCMDSDGEREVLSEEAAEGEQESLFVRGGKYLEELSGVFPESIVQSVIEKIAQSEERDINFGRFGAKGGVSPFRDALDEKELTYVFFEMIRSYMHSRSIPAEMTAISFDVGETFLKVEMWVTVHLENIAKKYSIMKLPQTACFRLRTSYIVENSELSAQNENVSLECESYPISRSLLLFGCKTLFGDSDPCSTFASVIKNVFVNAGIYR